MPSVGPGGKYTKEQLQGMTQEQLNLVSKNPGMLPSGYNLRRAPSLWGLFGDNPNPWKLEGPGADRPINNPGNLRKPGQTTGFAQFPNEATGLRAMADQLRRYDNKYGVDTVAGVVNKWAPASDGNDVEAYIRNVASRTGFKADQKLDLNDNDTLAKLMSAMTKQETGKSNYTPKVIVEVLNNTGGNAIVTSSQVAQ
jgi:hypothetical protein